MVEKKFDPFAKHIGKLPEAPFTGGVLGGEETNALWNMLGYTAWDFLNVSLLTVPGLVGEKTGMDVAFRNLLGLNPLQKSARVGSGIGGALGFIAPMKGAKKIIGAPFRHFHPKGTRKLQEQAADRLVASVAKTGEKGLSKADALRLVKEQTDDIIGFSGTTTGLKGFGQWFSGGKAAGMEVSDKVIENAQMLLKGKLPERLMGSLAKKGIRIERQAAVTLGDEIAGIVSQKPLNSISSIIINKFGPKYSFLGKLVGHSTQEAIEFAMVGTTMDFVSSFRDDRPDFDLMHSVLDHGRIGALLGITKMIPGGRAKGITRDFFKAFGFGTRKLNKKISNMDTHELRAMMRGRLRDKPFFRKTKTANGEDATLRIRNRDINSLTDAEMKKQLIKFNNQSLAILRSWKEGMPRQFAEDFLIPSKDMAGTWARMVSGAAILNFSNFGEFAHMDKDEVVFHLALGAVMTKQGHGSKDKAMYSRDQLGKAMRQLESVGLDVSKIDTIARVTDQARDLVLGSTENPDVDFLIRKLEESGFVFKAHREDGSDAPNASLKRARDRLYEFIAAEPKTERTGTDLENWNFLNMVQNIILPSLDIRGYDSRRPEVLLKELARDEKFSAGLDKIVSDIKMRKSEVLSTPESEIILGTDILTISRSYYQGAKDKIDALEIRLVEDYRDLVKNLTGIDPWDAETEKMNRLELDTEGLTAENQVLVDKLLFLREKLKDYNLIHETDTIWKATSTEKERETPSKKVFKIFDRDAKVMAAVLAQKELDITQSLLGRRVNDNKEILRLDQDLFLWQLISNKKHVVEISTAFDMIMNKKNPNFADGKFDTLQAKIIAIFGGKDDIGRIVERIPKMNDKELADYLEKNVPAEERDAFRAESQFLLKNIWRVLSTGKNIVKDERRNNVRPEDVASLILEMKEHGVVGYRGIESLVTSEKVFSQIQDWGFDVALGATKISPETKRVLGRLVEAGIAATKSAEAGGGAKFYLPDKITTESLAEYLDGMQAKTAADIKQKEIIGESIKETFQDLKRELESIVTFDDSYRLETMSEKQMIEILHTAAILENGKAFVDSSNFAIEGERLARELKVELEEIEKQINHLDPELPSHKSDLAYLKEKLKIREIQKGDLDNMMRILRFGIGDRGPFHAAAFIHFARQSGLMTMLETMSKKKEDLKLEGAQTASKAVEAAISDIVDNMNKVLDREDIVENVLEAHDAFAENKENIEGHVPKNENNRTTPEDFMMRNGITVDGLFLSDDNKVLLKGNKSFKITLEDKRNAHKLLTALYFSAGKNAEKFGLTLLRGIGKIDIKSGKWKSKYRGKKFETKMKHFASVDKAGAIKFRADVLKLAQNINSRFAINRLHVTMLGKSEAQLLFSKKEMPSGSFTDMITRAFGDKLGSDIFLIDNSVIENNRSKSFWDIDGQIDQALWNFNKTITAKNGLSRFRQIWNDITGTVEGKEVALAHRRLIRIPVDEHMTLVVPESSFGSLSKSFVDWFDARFRNFFTKEQLGKKLNKLYREKGDQGIIIDGGLEQTMQISRDKGAGATRIDRLFREFLTIRKQLLGIEKLENNKPIYDAKDLAQNGKRSQQMGDLFYKMFTSQYLASINSFGAFTDTIGLSASGLVTPGRVAKFYKYMRLSQNKAYWRNDAHSLELTKSLYSKDPMYGDLVQRFTGIKGPSTFVIKDYGTQGDRNKGLSDVVTAQGQMQAALKRMRKEGRINQKQYEKSLKMVQQSASGHDEGFNAPTFVSKDMLDFLFIQTGNINLIDRGSSGLKPVGASNRINADGSADIMVQKTHYFYDPSFDNFFKNNPDVHEITFDSAAKTHQKIRRDKKTNNFVNTFESFNLDSKFEKEGKSESLSALLNKKLGKIKGMSAENNNSVIQSAWEGTYNGTVYSGPGGVEISAPLGAFLGPEAKRGYYKWARSDAVNNFGQNVLHWLIPENSSDRIKDAQENMFEVTADGMGYSGEIYSFQKIWVKSGGDPLVSWMRDTYLSYIKNKHIDKAGMLGGFTDAGGKTVLRPNLDLDLDIPIFEEFTFQGDNLPTSRMVIFGETKKSEFYADRPLRWLFSNTHQGKVARPEFRKESEIFIAINMKDKKGKGFDIIMPLGEAIKARRERQGGKYGKIRYLDPREKDYINPGMGTNPVIKNLIKELDTTVGKDKLKNYGQLVHILTKASARDKGYQYNLVSTGGRIPRIGIHDILIQKVKNGSIVKKTVKDETIETYVSSFIDKAAGNVSESNMFDLALTMQADFDTDTELFYLSSPFELVLSNWKNKGPIREPLPSFETGAKQKDSFFNMWDRSERQNYDDQINGMRRMRADVIKTLRLVDFFATYFPKEGVSIGDGKFLKFRRDFTKSDKDGGAEPMKRLTNDSQWVMDIYAGIYETFLHKDSRGRSTWRDRTFFGNSQKEPGDKISVDGDKPFFYLERPATKETDAVRSLVIEPAIKGILEKIVMDYSKVINIESKLWEGGFSKTPSYRVMVDTWNRFRRFYDPEYVDKNMHDHLAYKKGINAQMMKAIFNPQFTERKVRGEKVPGKLIVNNILRKFALKMNERLFPLEKVLNEMSKDAYDEPINISGRIQPNRLARRIERKLVDERASNFYSALYSDLEPVDYRLDIQNINGAIREIMNGVKDDQARIAQANYLHKDIMNLEHRRTRESEEHFPSHFKIRRYEAELLTKKKTLDIYLNNLSAEFSWKVHNNKNNEAAITQIRKESGIKLSNRYRGKDRKTGLRQSMALVRDVYIDKKGHLHNDSNKDIWIGRMIKEGVKGEEEVRMLTILGKGETWKDRDGNSRVVPAGAFAMENPVIIRPTTSYDAVDSAALYYTIQGSTLFINPKDRRNYRTIVIETQKKINKVLRNAKNEIAPDWTNDINPEIDRVIDYGIDRIFRLATKEKDDLPALSHEEILFGETIHALPAGKEGYVRDFLIALLHPGHVANINEYHVIKGIHVPALKSMRPSIVKAVFRAFETYGGEGMIPRVEELIKNIAYSHKAFSDGFMDKKSMLDVAEQIAESGWELALTAHNVADVYGNPFGKREDIPLRKEIELLGDDTYTGKMLGKILNGQTILDPSIVLRLRNRLTSETRDELENRLRYNVIDGQIMRAESSTEGNAIVIGDFMGKNNYHKNLKVLDTKSLNRISEALAKRFLQGCDVW